MMSEIERQNIENLSEQWKFPMSSTFRTNCKLLILTSYSNWSEMYQSITGNDINKIYLDEMLSVEKNLDDKTIETVLSTLKYADLEDNTSFLNKLFSRYVIDNEPIFESWNPREKLTLFLLSNMNLSEERFKKLIQKYFNDDKLTFDIQQFIKENKQKELHSKKYLTIVMKELFLSFSK